MNLIEPHPPHLDLAYYTGHDRLLERAVRAVEALVAVGAIFTGTIEMSEDEPDSRKSVKDIAALAKYGGATPERIYLRNATGISKATEFIRLTKNSILLRTEADDFCGPSRNRRRRLYEQGSKAYACFKVLAQALDAAYGGICIDEGLGDPATLKQNPKTLAFQNFFLSRSRLSEQAISDALAKAGPDAYVEMFDRGVYVSMSPELNPEHQAIDPIDSQYRSVAIAEVLARHLRGVEWA